MIVSATWFLWLWLYASTSRWLNWSVAARTHIVSWVPSSGLAVLPLLFASPAHAVRVNANATAATLVNVAMSSPLRFEPSIRKIFRDTAKAFRTIELYDDTGQCPFRQLLWRKVF